MTNTTERPPNDPDQASTLTLTDFLLARITEDEGYAPKYHHAMCEWAMRGDRGATEDDCDCGLDARQKFHLAECEAKRRIVDWAAPVTNSAFPSGGRYVSDDGLDLLCILALPYADHPDYRQEWRP